MVPFLWLVRTNLVEIDKDYSFVKRLLSNCALCLIRKGYSHDYINSFVLWGSMMVQHKSDIEKVLKMMGGVFSDIHLH